MEMVVRKPPDGWIKKLRKAYDASRAVQDAADRECFIEAGA